LSIIRTVLNSSQAAQTNIFGGVFIPVSPNPVTLVIFGHFVPSGTVFVEVDVTIGWQPELFSRSELVFSLYQNGQLVAEATDSGENGGDVLSSLNAILQPPTNQHHVYELRVRSFSPTSTTVIRGPLTVSISSYGTP
jgi:hypothetical protein